MGVRPGERSIPLTVRVGEDMLGLLQVGGMGGGGRLVYKAVTEPRAEAPCLAGVHG